MTNGINTREMILEILLQINEEGEHRLIILLIPFRKFLLIK